MALLLPDNYIYISHLDEDHQIWWLPCAPEEISDTMSSTFSETTALGRSAPIFTYSSSGPRKVQLNIHLHRDMMDEANTGRSNVDLGFGDDYIDSLIRALQAIAVPKYNLSNKAIEPPLVVARLGQQVYIRGIVSSGIGLTYKLPIQSNGKYAQVTLSLEITEVDPYDASTVFKNGSFRGMVKTLELNGKNV